MGDRDLRLWGFRVYGFGLAIYSLEFQGPEFGDLGV